MSASSQKSRLVAFGVALHALLIYSIFDVHFLTPQVDGMQATAPEYEAPAKRLVIIVADGLRGDRLFEMEAAPHAPGADALLPGFARTPRAPFLHRMAREHGRWGISHARPPTESRPGHVALLAGFYEDPSAITKGWQANAVEFDHLLNQSSAAWALGAPSVVPLFAKGIPHVRSRMYAEELEDFAAASDHAALDTWVFDRTIEVLDGNVTEEEAAAGATVASERAALEGGAGDGPPNRVVFLLHLLGLDSAGHAHRPGGEGSVYAANVQAVDAGVRRMVGAFDARFGDDRGTAFIFTADHGMSSRGAHGDGDPGCTETPLVAWGAGVASVASAAAAAAAAMETGDAGALAAAAGAHAACRPRGKDAPTSRPAWGLEDATRCDVDQADVASLGAALLGMPPPRHNAGMLPVAYLDPALPSLRSGAAASTAAQLLSVYRRKVLVTAGSSLTAYLTPGGLRAYAPLIDAEDTLAGVRTARARGDHAAAVAAAQVLSRACAEGVTYLHLYDRALLMGVITTCFVGWMAFLGVNLAVQGPGGEEAEARVEGGGWLTSSLAAAVSCAVCAVLRVREAPVTYYAYFNLPVYFAWYCCRALAGTSRRAGARAEAALRAAENRQTQANREVRASGGNQPGDGDRQGDTSVVVRWLNLGAAATAAVGVTQVLCQSFHDRTVYSGVFVTAWCVLSLLSGRLMLSAGAVPGFSARASATASASSRHGGGGRCGGVHHRRAAVRASAAALAAAGASFALAPFTVFSVELAADTTLVVAGVGCAAAAGLVAHFILRPLDLFGDDPTAPDPDSAAGHRRPGYALLVVQLSLLWAAGFVVWLVDGLQAARATIPRGVHAAAWCIAAAAAPLPFLSPARTLPRFTSVYLAAAAVYALFSVSYESLFYAALGAGALAWLVLERCCQKLAAISGNIVDKDSEIDTDGDGDTNGDAVFSSIPTLRGGLRVGDVRHAVVFLVLINAAFFGTGNIASVASFEISSVYRFTTRFNPFLMGGLLMLKVLIPMTTVAVAFLALLKLQRVPAFPMYLVFLVLSDLMAVRFFFQVTTEGSWQDIGHSISRYSLMGTQVVTMLLFMGLADLVTSDLPVNGLALSIHVGVGAEKKKRN
jgi:phosphatidylinositol glycan class N